MSYCNLSTFLDLNIYIYIFYCGINVLYRTVALNVLAFSWLFVSTMQVAEMSSYSGVVVSDQWLQSQFTQVELRSLKSKVSTFNKVIEMNYVDLVIKI